MPKPTRERAAELIKGCAPVDDQIIDSPKGLRRQFTMYNKHQAGGTCWLPVTSEGEIDMERLCS